MGLLTAARKLIDCKQPLYGNRRCWYCGAYIHEACQDDCEWQALRRAVEEAEKGEAE